MNRCTRCVLPTSFPGISFDAEGLCNHCRRGSVSATQLDLQRRYREKFEVLIGELAGRSSHDVLMAYSGGKDSTYTLDIFVNRYKLRVLALTFDNAFLSGAALENVKTVCASLGADSLVVQPDAAMLKRVFGVAAEEELFASKTLERASTICTSCIGMVKGVTLRTAIERAIPFVGFGWSPGQAPVQASVMKTNAALMRTTQRAIQEPLRRVAGAAVDPYFVSDEQFELADNFPWNVHPLAFLDYDEEAILDRIRELGWTKPDDTDPNSTNCLLNSYANQLHRERYGFHPYVWEIANIVRSGAMTREEGLAKVEPAENERLVNLARQSLVGA